jgi:hypothetical protein
MENANHANLAANNSRLNHDIVAKAKDYKNTTSRWIDIAEDFTTLRQNRRTSV